MSALADNDAELVSGDFTPGFDPRAGYSQPMGTSKIIKHWVPPAFVECGHSGYTSCHEVGLPSLTLLKAHSHPDLLLQSSSVMQYIRPRLASADSDYASGMGAHRAQCTEYTLSYFLPLISVTHPCCEW